MKKILAFAAVAMLALGAQADYSYTVQYNVNITKCEDTGVTAKDGTIPGDVVVSLIDKGNGATIYSKKIQFEGLTVTYNGGANSVVLSTDNYIRTTDGRFDVMKFVTDHGTGTMSFANETQAESQKLTFSYTDPSKGGNGYSVQLSGMLDFDTVWAGATKAGATEYPEYAKENLQTVLTANSKNYALDIKSDSTTILSSSSTLKEVQPVPEPTSGVLLVMGLAGLALKRKRAA